MRKRPRKHDRLGGLKGVVLALVVVLIVLPPLQAEGPDSGLVGASSPAPGPGDEEVSVGGDWEAPIDPGGGCKIIVDETGNHIRITVPESPRVLNAEIGRMDAPRVLRTVQGDFDVSVRVNGVFHPSGRSTMKQYAPYHGAGILLWQDERNYLRLEIAADIHRGRTRPYANFEWRRDGELASSKGMRIEDGSNRLLLQRRGDEIRASFSRDGNHWTRFAPLTVDFRDNIKVGADAINTATNPLFAELEMFELVKPETSDRGRPRDSDLAAPDLTP